MSHRSTRNRQKRVDFLIAGTQKGGTTALREYMLQHPEVCMTRRAEGHFFDHGEHFIDPTPDYSSYHAEFEPVENQRVLGDNTPIYMYWQDAPQRIWQYNPAMKFIILLRDPARRAYSHWSMEHTRGADDVDFWTALCTEQDRCREALPLQHRVFSYTDRGFYTEQLRRLWRFFPREQTLILKSDELRAFPVSTLDRISEFLAIDPFPALTPLTARVQDYPATMTPREALFLADLFVNEVRQLERMLDWDCSDWLKPA